MLALGSITAEALYWRQGMAERASINEFAAHHDSRVANFSASNQRNIADYCTTMTKFWVAAPIRSVLVESTFSLPR